MRHQKRLFRAMFLFSFRCGEGGGVSQQGDDRDDCLTVSEWSNIVNCTI